MSSSSHGPMSAGGTSSRASPRSLGPRPRPSTRSARAAAAPSTSIAGTKAPSTAQPRAVAAVAMTRDPRRAARAKPAATRGSRMAATTAPRRPPPTAVVTTAVLDQARAASARAHPARVITRAARYAVSVASGRARPSSAATAAPTGELAGSAPGRCFPSQARAASTARCGLCSPEWPSAAPCQPSSQACHSVRESARTPTSSPPVRPVSRRCSRPPGRSLPANSVTTVAMATATTPGLRAAFDIQDVERTCRSSASSDTGPLSSAERVSTGACGRSPGRASRTTWSCSRSAGVPQGRAGAHEEPGQVAAAQASGAPRAPAGAEAAPGVEDGTEVGELGPGGTRLLGGQQQQPGRQAADGDPRGEERQRPTSEHRVSATRRAPPTA